MGRRPGPLLAAAATSIPPEVLQPVRRQRRVGGRADDRPMVAMREQAGQKRDMDAAAPNTQRMVLPWQNHCAASRRDDEATQCYVLRTPTGTRSRTSTPATTKLRPGGRVGDEGEARQVAVNVARQPSPAKIYRTARPPSAAPLVRVLS
jgi:hypothetical protein